MLRQIDLEMNKAVRSRVPLLKDNTEVRVSKRLAASVFLFGNIIARVVGSYIVFSKQCVEEDEWRTATTKRRINALLHEFIPDLALYQFKGKWYFSREKSHSLVWNSDHVTINRNEEYISINYIRHQII